MLGVCVYFSNIYYRNNVKYLIYVSKRKNKMQR